jgi:hypothetical protein
LLVAGAAIVAQKMLIAPRKTNEVAQHKETNKTEPQVMPATVNDTAQAGNNTATTHNTSTTGAPNKSGQTDAKDIVINSANGGKGTTSPEKIIEIIAEKKKTKPIIYQSLKKQ